MLENNCKLFSSLFANVFKQLCLKNSGARVNYFYRYVQKKKFNFI